MGKRRYFLDAHPVTIMHLGGDNYYFRLKQLVSCLHLNFEKVRASINRRFIIEFARLRERYPSYDEHTAHPSTLMLHIDGLNALLSKFCPDARGALFRKFLQKCLAENGKTVDSRLRVSRKSDLEESEVEDDEEFQPIASIYGVLPSNVEYVSMNDETFFKGVDVARAMGCSPSYTINKYVDDENMILWVDLKRRVWKKYLWTNFVNRWKNNTIFLNREGVRQLSMASTGNQDAYRDLIAAKDTNDESIRYVRPRSKYVRKHPKADGCTVGKDGDLEFIVTPDGKVHYKLNQIVKKYGLRVCDYEHYGAYLKQWDEFSDALENCNIAWKKNLVLISGQGVYKMLEEVGLVAQAEDFVYKKIHNARGMWSKEHKSKSC